MLTAHAPAGMVKGISRLDVFDETLSYDDLPSGHIDQIIDLSSYPYSYKHASSRRYSSIVRRDLDQPWLIHNGEEEILCPALTPDSGWFSVNKQASAMLCELPIINLALGRSADDLTLFMTAKAMGPLPVSGATKCHAKELKKTDVLLLIGGAHLSKRYPLERWVEVVANLEAAGLKVEALGGPDETELVQQLNALGISSVLSRDLARTIDIITASRLSISNDCGPMHVALMVGLPVVGIFGPTVAGSWFAQTTPMQRSLQLVDAVAQSSDLIPSGSWTLWPTSSEVSRQAMNLLAMEAFTPVDLNPNLSSSLRTE